MNSDQDKPTAGDEVAERFYERYINQREWIKGKSITQGEFLSKLAEIINAALAAEADNWRKVMSAAADLAKQTFDEKDRQLDAKREAVQQYKTAFENANDTCKQLREQLATLVDALKECADCDEVEHIARAALAKAKQ